MKNAAINLFERVSRRAGLLKRHGDSYDVIDVAFLKAAFEAAEFYEEHLTAAKAFEDTLVMIGDACAMAEPWPE